MTRMFTLHNSPAAMFCAGSSDVPKVSQGVSCTGTYGKNLRSQISDEFQFATLFSAHESAQMEQGLSVTYRRLCLIAVLLLLAPTRLRAHQEIPRAGRGSVPGAVRAFSGSVVDPSGASIPNAQVTVSQGANVLGETKTDAVGAFRLANLIPGNYQLAVHADGFVDAHLQASVADRKSNAVRVVLQIAVQAETVTVAGANVPLVSTATSDNQNANTIDRNALDRVPVFDQDYITAMSRFLDDNAIGTNGVTLVVNGIEANGPGVTPCAVQEVRINNNPYSARFSRPGRARHLTACPPMGRHPGLRRPVRGVTPG